MDRITVNSVVVLNATGSYVPHTGGRTVHLERGSYGRYVRKACNADLDLIPGSRKDDDHRLCRIVLCGIPQLFFIPRALLDKFVMGCEDPFKQLSPRFKVPWHDLDSAIIR